MPNIDCGFKDTPGTSAEALLTTLGPTLNVNIGFDPTYQGKANSTLMLNASPFNALVDTGAAESCIDISLASQLNLPVVDRQQIAGSSGAHTTNIYLAQVVVNPIGFVIYGRFAGVNLIAGGQPHYALLGRTFLRNFDMVYNGKTGSVTLTLA